MNTEPMPKCPQCGALLPPGTPDGLCPRCVMAMNLKTETVFTDDPPTAQPPLPPEQIAPHFPSLEILECLGRGGMGVVYRARQKTLNRLVALKLLAPERAGDAKFAERFSREAQALAALNHPNIVTIYDFGQAGGYYYLLMEFVDGLNLRQLLRSRKFTPEEALAIVPPLCDALQFAHDQGIVHRDIKPENLLLDKAGRVKVADFGIAKIMGGEKSDSAGAGYAPAGSNVLTDADKTMGTPGYSAPEQKTDPQRVDSRADIYSLGVVFYEMLTGELPGKKIAPPSTKVQIDVRLDEIVLRALEQKPELRYQQASVLKTQVETIAGSAEAPLTKPGFAPNLENERWKIQAWGLALAAACVEMGLNLNPIYGWMIGIWGVLLFGVTTGLALVAGDSLKKIQIAAQLVCIDGLVTAVGGIVCAFADDYLQVPWRNAIIMGCIGGIMYALTALNYWTKVATASGRPPGRPLPAKTPIVRAFENYFGFTFTSRAAIVVGNFSNLGMFGLWGMLSEIPGLEWFRGAYGFFGFFGLLGVAFVIEWPDVKTAGKTPTDTSPHFSRTAIWGACGLGVVLQAVFLRNFIYGEHAKAWMAISQVEKVGFVFADTVVLAACLAPFITTILGWIAVSQIRRSAGKIHGLWLAIFDGLFFPLLAFDFVIYLFASHLQGVWIMAMRNSETNSASEEDLVRLIFAIMVFFICALVDWLIIRRVWRAVNQPVEGAYAGNPSQSTVPPAGNKFQRWLKKNLLVKLPVAIVIAMIIRTFFLQAFRVETDAAAPEIPRGSHFLVWKLTHHFAPGDIIAYHKGGFVNVGRVASDAGTVIVNRNGEADEPLPRNAIIGKVISVYWRGSSDAILDSADFHYRIFVADAALVDRLIPVEQRQVGVISNVKPELVEGQVTGASTNGVFTKTDSQMAMINSVTLGALFYGMETKPGLLVDERRNISLQRNNNSVGTSIGWAHTFADRTLTAGTAGGGPVKLQRQGGILMARIECQFQYQDIQYLVNSNANFMQSKILYYGSAPPPGIAQAFLVPFVRNDKTVHYLVIIFDVGKLTEQALPAAAAQNAAFGPVMERTVSDGSVGTNAFLNLATGGFTIPPPELAAFFRDENWIDSYREEGEQAKQVQSWLRANQVDVLFNHRSEQRGVALLDGFAVADSSASGAEENGGQYWELSTAQLVNLMGDFEQKVGKLLVLPRPCDFTMFTTMGLLPRSFCFKTRNGAVGVLQITGFNEHPRGVNVRYKLVAVPIIEASLKFLEVPAGLPLDLAKFDLAAVEKQPGVNLLSAPRVTTGNGRECEIEVVQGTAKDAFAPTPTGVTARLRPTLDGDTVHYAAKFTLSSSTDPGDAARTTTQELAHSGDASLNKPVVFELGTGENNPRLLAWMVFHRIESSPQQ
jgi:signal peptidase I